MKSLQIISQLVKEHGPTNSPLTFLTRPTTQAKHFSVSSASLLPHPFQCGSLNTLLVIRLCCPFLHSTPAVSSSVQNESFSKVQISVFPPNPSSLQSLRNHVTSCLLHTAVAIFPKHVLILPFPAPNFRGSPLNAVSSPRS